MNTEMQDAITIMENLPEQVEMFGFMLDNESGESVAFNGDLMELNDYISIGEALRDNIEFKNNLYALVYGVLAFEDDDQKILGLYKVTRQKLKQLNK